MRLVANRSGNAAGRWVVTGRMLALGAIVGLTLPACSFTPPPGAGDRPNPGGSAGEVLPSFAVEPSYRISMLYSLTDETACGPGWSDIKHTLFEASEGEISFDADHPLEADIVYSGTGTVEVTQTFTLKLCPEWMPPEGAEPCNENVEWLALANVTAMVLQGAEAAAFNVEDPDPDQSYLYFWFEGTSVAISDEADCDRPDPDASTAYIAPGRAVPMPEAGDTIFDDFQQASDPATVQAGISRIESWSVKVEAPLPAP